MEQNSDLAGITSFELSNLYWSHGLSTYEIAERCGCGDETVRLRMVKDGIPRRRAGPRLLPGNLRLPSEEWKFSYLAGIIDGEGSIVFQRDKSGVGGPHCHRYGVHPTILIKNTDRGLIEWVVAEFGGCYSGHRQKNQPAHYKLSLQWRMVRIVDVLALLRRLEPYLLVKRKEARALISHCEKLLAEDKDEVKDIVDKKVEFT